MVHSFAEGRGIRATASGPVSLVVLLTPNFNLAATVGFIDPLRAANYLAGAPVFRWRMASAVGGPLTASNGLTIETQPLSAVLDETPRIAVISSSWTPESHIAPELRAVLRRWARARVTLAAIDTGAFILASLGLLAGRRATVHYEHIDALRESYPDIEVTEQLMVIDGERMTCCGGIAAVDFGLHVVRSACGDALANGAARYLFHDRLRAATSPQNPSSLEPLGSTVSNAVRKAIRVMERNLEIPLPIPRICDAVGISQRQLIRLFARYVRRSPTIYYRDIRLDRARGLVTQTDRPLSDIAVASGFPNQGHFSRAYRSRFGVSPREDRIEGRIPFEFRAWPMYGPQALGPGQRTRMAKKGKRKAI